ncbi:MAG: hypothetical protein PCFJNLEI_02998 [Verrucomicrobiae bacterium]|nr:hypothetical protein [Verrucomicrobiae bacterium]
MKNNRKTLSALVLVLIVTQSVAADNRTAFFVGQIESLNIPQRILIAKGATSSMTFTVAADAKIFGPDKKELKLTDLKVGQEVTVDYDLINGLAVAHTITLKEPVRPPLPGDKPVPL